MEERENEPDMPRIQTDSPSPQRANWPEMARSTVALPQTDGSARSADPRTTISDAPRGTYIPPNDNRANDAPQATPAKKKNMRANINIATLNMNGLTAPTSGMTFLEKWSMVNQTLNKYKIAVLALQETHLDQEVVETLRECFGRKMHIEYSHDPNAPRTTAGVAFVVNKTLIAPSAIHAHTLSAGRALALKINWLEAESTTFLNVYAPVNKNTHPVFWATIERERLAKRLPRPDFLLGDLNVTEDPIDRAPAKADDQGATDALRDTRLAWNVQDAWRLMYPEEREYTYRANSNGQQIKSRLDRIYVASRLVTSTFNWIITPSPVPTDHWLVVVKYAPKDAPEIGKGCWTLPLHLLQNNKFVEKVVTRGIKLQSDLLTPHTERNRSNAESPQLLWETFKADIQDIAKDMLTESHYKLISHIRNLEKDRAALANAPDTDTNNDTRTSEAIIAKEIEHLEEKRAKGKKDMLSVELARHGEKLGGAWSAINKDRKPRDLIRRLQIPGSNPPQYERNSERMAELARQYHENLQHADLPADQDDEEERVNLILNEIPKEQRLKDTDAAYINLQISETQTGRALHLSKNGSATGMDGCPYELWKKLRSRHEHDSEAGKPSFDVVKTLTLVFRDIQTNGVEKNSCFALGWMCPIYKKKDRTEISNYRPITLLNTDYKILTKVLALQLKDHIESLVHRDQAGFIPKRSIFDHIRLANIIIDYAEVTEMDGAIVALDQEKAYDKIRHEYLWDTLKAFNLPDTFVNTIKSLYHNAMTQVAINGFFSEPYRVTRGIRQGDPLSCSIFDLAIEPLACAIRKDVNFKGITVPGIEEPLKAKFFADDTSVYMSKSDKFDFIKMLLGDWCRVSGAKFNLEKTEVVPIGSETHRQQVVESRKINPLDEILSDRIKLAEDGVAIRFLGAWIGNHTNDIVPWEPVIDKVNKDLQRWGTSRPTMRGRKVIAQAITGGRTQYLTMAQGMPENIEKALIKIMRKFMWGDDSSPRIALDFLQSPVEEGGLNLLDITARNEAIELMWLKSYLNISPSRPEWAAVTDLLIDTAAPPELIQKARGISFLQSWKPKTRGQRAKRMGKDTARMIKTAKKFDTNLEALRLTPHLRTLLPAWYHLASNPRPITGTAAKCLLNNHRATTVAHLIRISARTRNPNPNPNRPHQPKTFCYCADCSGDRMEGCRNPNACAQEAQTRLEHILPKFNPLSPGTRHGDLSLTSRRKGRNEVAKANNGEILFDPSLTSKGDLAECFRIFTDPSRISDTPASRIEVQGTRMRLQEVTVYTDGACINNGKANAKCGSGVWFGPNHRLNKAIRVPGKEQSNQIGELAAIIVAVEAVPVHQPLRIVTDSRYAIEGLTDNLRNWEDQGWIGIKNAKLFKKAAFLLERRTAKTSFQWVKGHTGDQGNEGSDQLAKAGAEKEEADTLDLSIPINFDLQGAKLKTLTQRVAYRGIMERRKITRRKAADESLEKVRAALNEYNGELETDETIWKGIQSPAIRIRVRQHLYKVMHQTPKVGTFWEKVRGHENRRMCQTCQVTETMEHILTQCRTPAVQKIWQLAKQSWPHDDIPFPEISLGIILGCGAISPPQTTTGNGNENAPRRRHRPGTKRLLQILISEAEHLIWVLRCERVIQKTNHSESEIEKRWHRVINRRLTEDKITATKIKRDSNHIKLTNDTWEAVLTKEGELPDRWMMNREVLVGRSARA